MNTKLDVIVPITHTTCVRACVRALARACVCIFVSVRAQMFCALFLSMPVFLFPVGFWSSEQSKAKLFRIRALVLYRGKGYSLPEFCTTTKVIIIIILIKRYSLTRVKLTALYKHLITKTTLTYTSANKTLIIVA